MTDDTNRRRAEDYADKWHLDRKVPVGIIVALLVQAIVAAMAFSDVRKDVEYLKTELRQQTERDDKQDRINSDALAALRSDIRSVNDKLDRLIERKP